MVLFSKHMVELPKAVQIFLLTITIVVFSLLLLYTQSVC